MLVAKYEFVILFYTNKILFSFWESADPIAQTHTHTFHECFITSKMIKNNRGTEVFNAIKNVQKATVHEYRARDTFRHFIYSCKIAMVYIRVHVF